MGNNLAFSPAKNERTKEKVARYETDEGFSNSTAIHSRESSRETVRLLPKRGTSGPGVRAMLQ